MTKSRQQDRSALIDITNDSPIVGVAMGNLKTPSSAMSKKRMSGQGLFSRTPGSGEALLRGQVKTLLQKVEEEAELSKITLEKRPFFNLEGLITLNSPINLVAPTPANTPQILSLSANTSNGLPCATPSPVDEKFLIPPQMISEMLEEKKEVGTEFDENVITRSLLLDFSERSIDEDTEKVSADDDDASVWSIQVNASSTRDDEDEECIEEECDDDYYCYGEEEHDDFGNEVLLDELCEGMSKISVKGGPKFMGKHIRFTYNSDDELIEEEEKVFRGGECECES
ncbi:hypothetical protein DH2020_015620 [Rehmannia glutinosa]|uniref:Uncharacterized protein n=1 Tax=Rehmannia glutinosa TaxID=99300 RepID=A0ABR0WT59_REHGL